MGYIGKWHLDAPEAPFVPSYNNPMEGRYWNDWTPPENATASILVQLRDL